jgi:hypothetical protein
MTQIIGLEAANGFTKTVTNAKVDTYENRLLRRHGREMALLGGKTQETEYTYMGERYVLSNKGSTSGGRNMKRYTTKEFLIENLVAISRVQKEKNVILTTGLPCEDYNDPALIAQTKSRLLGNHTIYKGETKHDIKVVEVHVIPQPLGTLIDFMFDGNLQVINGRNEYKYLVIDIGRGTTDILLSDGMTAETLIGADIGCMDISNLYLQYINQDYAGRDFRFTLEDIGVNNQSKINKYEQTFDFSKHLAVAKEEIHKQIMTFINDSGISFKMADRVIYTGGGSKALDGHLPVAENIKVHPHAQTGNARGYFKFGLHKGAK